MHLNLIDISVLVAYFASMLALGLYQARKVKNTGDFFAGGRKFNKFLMMMHALGTGTHADDPVAVVGASYANGLAGIWYTFVYLFVTPFYWIIAPLFRRARFLTTADFFEARFGSKLGTLYAFWGIIIFSVNIGMLLVATGKIITAISPGTDPLYAIVGMAVVFVVYGTAGGLVATVITESVQGLLIVVMSLLLIPFGLAKLGGFHGLHTAVTNPDMFALTGKVELNMWWIIAGSISMLIGIVAQPHIMEVCSTGKTEFEGRIGFTYGNFVKRLCSIGWALTGVVLIGMVARGQVAGVEREQAFGAAIRTLLPPGFIGLMFAAILAAQMSTLSAFMVAASALLSRNVYKKQLRPEADDKKVLAVGRWAGFVIVGLGILFAASQKDVVDALMWFWTLATFTGVFMWAGVLWKKANATGAWASFVVMLAIWLVVGEPGQAVSQFTARRSYQPPVATQLNAPTERFSRALLDVVSVKEGKGDRREIVAFSPKASPTGLGVEISGMSGTELTSIRDSLKSKPRLVEGIESGMMVRNVADAGVAKQAGLKPGDVIIRCSRMPYPGIYADKSIMQYRLAAYLPAGILALIIGSLLGAPHPKDKLDKFYALLRTPVGKEDELVAQGVDVVYAGASKGHPWEMEHGRAVNVIGFAIALVISLLFVLLLWGVGRIGA